MPIPGFVLRKGKPGCRKAYGLVGVLPVKGREETMEGRELLGRREEAGANASA